MHDTKRPLLSAVEARKVLIADGIVAFPLTVSLDDNDEILVMWSPGKGIQTKPPGRDYEWSPAGPTELSVFFAEETPRWIHQQPTREIE